MKYIFTLFVVLTITITFSQVKSDSIKFEEFKTLIQESYFAFNIIQPFEDKYNNDYFVNHKFEKLTEIDLIKIKNSKLLIEILLITEKPNSSLYKRANQTMDFNTNVLTLDSITKNVLEVKYDSLKVISALNKINTLPNLLENSEMRKYKSNLKSLLNNYDSICCIAYSKYKNMSDLLKPRQLDKIDKSRLDIIYNNEVPKEYTYLQKVFNALKEDPNNFNKEEYQIPNTCYKYIPKVQEIKEEGVEEEKIIEKE